MLIAATPGKSTRKTRTAPSNATPKMRGIASGPNTPNTATDTATSNTVSRDMRAESAEPSPSCNWDARAKSAAPTTPGT